MLPLTVDKIDTIPEAFRGEYAERDGKFHLNVDGLPDVDGLKKALNAERDANKTAKQQAAAWSKLGKTAEEVEAMLEAERKKAEDAALKAGKFDEVLQTHLGNAKKERDEAVSAATKERDSALNVARDALKTTHLNGALVKAKATAEGLAALPKLLGDRVKVEFEDGKPKVSILADDGSPMVGSGTGGLATYDDLVKEAIKTFPSLFEGTGGGTGAPSKGGGNHGPKSINRKDFDALDPAAKSAKIKDGFTVVD